AQFLKARSRNEFPSIPCRWTIWSSPFGRGFLDRLQRSLLPSKGTTVMRKTVAAIAMVCVWGSSAEARSHHRHHAHYSHHYHHHHRYASAGYSHSGRPRAWCGWYMRSQVGSDPGPEYNLARSWAHYGSNAGGPSGGALLVLRHHCVK